MGTFNYGESVEQDHKVYGEKKLAELGYTDWEVVVAEPNQLQIDYDSPEIPQRFNDALEILKQRFVQPLLFSKYRSKGGNYHIVIHCPIELSIHERIAWQAAFGSDFKREALSLISVSKGYKNPVLLFMNKDRKDEPVTVQAVGRKYRTEE